MSGATLSRLGFGCSSLGSEIAYRDGCTLIEAAFDAGFRHFDVAPPYGNGMAERIVGDVLQSVRKQVVLVSKAGIAHPRLTGAVHVARRALQPIKRRFPGLWKRAATRARQAAAPAGQFAPEEVAASLDESLRRLRTDHLDALLLHEIGAGGIDDGLARLLERVRSDGRAKAIGTATGVAASLALLADHPRLIDWVQCPHYWGAFEPGLCHARRLLLHRALRTGPLLVRSAQFTQAPGLPMQAALRGALEDRAALPGLLLRAALSQVPPNGVVLVSTLRRERLRGLVSWATSDPDPQLSALLNRTLAACVSSIAAPESLAEATVSF